MTTPQSEAQSYAGTIICLAKVVSIYDPGSTGSFKAEIFFPGLDSGAETVWYCSPWVTQTEGGFIAPPVVDNIILVCKPSHSEKYFYLGSTFFPSYDSIVGGKIDEITVSPYAAADSKSLRAKGLPMRQSFRGSHGGGLIIAEENNDSFYNWKTELVSALGKKITLDDTPGVDSIILDSGNNSRITLSNQHFAAIGNPSLFAPGMSKIQVESAGDQLYDSAGGTTTIKIQDGKELNILNSSTGSKKSMLPPPIQWLPPPIASNAEYGNINIQSKFKDVNIFTDTSQQDNYSPTHGFGTGRIFLECLNTRGSQQVIQLQTRGEGVGTVVPRPGYGSGDCVIRIKSSGKVEIQSAGNIDIECNGTINMRATGNLNLAAGGDVNIQSGGNINADGTQIHLNSELSLPAIPIIGSDYPNYGEGGVE